jgi:Holliday junction resolvase
MGDEQKVPNSTDKTGVSRDRSLFCEYVNHSFAAVRVGSGNTKNLSAA